VRKPTIYEALRDKLGREPTNAELRDDCRRIIAAGREMAACDILFKGKGKPRRTRRR
jgi:hypothetical protein